MTICVAVKVHDCLAIAADSASSISAFGVGAPVGIRRVYQHGNKVFNLFKGKPICAMTAGLGNIGPLSISTVAKDLRKALQHGDLHWKVDGEAYTIEEVAEKSRQFFEQRFAQHGLVGQPLPDLQFWVGGYSSDEDQSELWEVKFVQGACAAPQLKMAKHMCGVEMGGQPEALHRLVLGYSQLLPDALIKAGLDAAVVNGVLQSVAQNGDFQLVEPAMPAQDAIALVDFLAETVKTYVSFQPGPDTVGGRTDIAAVTKHEGFKWIRRKHYYPGELNPLETDHA